MEDEIRKTHQKMFVSFHSPKGYQVAFHTDDLFFGFWLILGRKKRNDDQIVEEKKLLSQIEAVREELLKRLINRQVRIWFFPPVFVS